MREEEDLLLQENRSFDYKALIPKVIRIWPYILLSVVVFFLAGYFWTKYTVPLYSVSSLFFVKEKESALALFDAPSIMDNGNLGLQNEVIVIKSKPIAEKTLEQLDFNVEYFEEGQFINNEVYRNIPILAEIDWKSPQIINGLLKISWVNSKQYTVSFVEEVYWKYLPDGNVIQLEILPKPQVFNFGELIQTNNFTFKITKTNINESGEILIKLRDLSSLVWEYASNLQIQKVDRNASILSLSLVTSNPVKGEVYLNKLMDTYLKLELEEKNEIAESTIAFIDSQVAGVADSLRFFEGQLETFRSSNKIYDLENESSIVYEQLVQYETQLKQEEFKKSYYQKLKDYLVRENYRDIIVPSGIGIEDPILNTLITNLLSLQVDKSRILATNTDDSPVVKEVNRKISDLNLSIQQALGNVDTNSAFLINDLKNRIDQIEVSFRSLPQTQQNLIRIKRQFDLNENIYTFLSQRRAESAITKASNTANNKVIEPATSLGKVSPRDTRNYFLSIMAGLFFPIMLVFIREIARTKIEDVKFLENRLKIPVLSTILFNKKKNSLAVFEQGKSGIAEGFRSLRANIKFILPTEN